jgi:SAM-dependent methyltransferase
MPEESGSYFYKDHPETCDPDDFWGQVKRTVNGEPVSQEQIDMIVHAVSDGMDLSAEDLLLDLCCGNGALTAYFFEKCNGGLGVDISEYLIDVARKKFVKRENESFVVGDAVEYVRNCSRPERFTKAVCYGAFMFLPRDNARLLLEELRSRFSSLRRVFIGNLPDRALKSRFFTGEGHRPGIEDDPGSPTGIWRTEVEFVELAAECGWAAVVTRMPPSFYAAHYRFDAVLSPLSRPVGSAPPTCRESSPGAT